MTAGSCFSVCKRRAAVQEVGQKPLITIIRSKGLFQVEAALFVALRSPREALLRMIHAPAQAKESCKKFQEKGPKVDLEASGWTCDPDAEEHADPAD